MEKVIAKLMQAAELDVYQGHVTKGDIENLAARTGCTLPEDYVKFLESCGFATWVGHSVNGIYDENDSRFPKSYNFSAVRQTMRARQMHADHKYPNCDHSIVIGKDDMGGYFLLISADIVTPHRVVWVNMDEDWVFTDRWESFEKFLDSQLSK